MRYKLLEEDKVRYICLVLLNEIVQFQHYFPVISRGNDMFLDHYLQILEKNGNLAIKSGKYIPTDKGREELVTLYNKYYEYLKIFDIFCAVDLATGEFAFSSINDDSSDEDWSNFINSPRFSDVRVAVADFKGLNSVEIVFLSFLNENRFDCGLDGWQNRLTSDAIWIEIIDICNTAIDVDYLKKDGVIVDVITKGTKIALDLIKQAESSLVNDQEQEEIVTEEVVTEEYVDVVSMPSYSYSYWDPYYDPYYLSPLWMSPVIFLY